MDHPLPPSSILKDSPTAFATFDDHTIPDSAVQKPAGKDRSSDNHNSNMWPMSVFTVLRRVPVKVPAWIIALRLLQFILAGVVLGALITTLVYDDSHFVSFLFLFLFFLSLSLSLSSSTTSTAHFIP
jgi:hypothetical protein